MEINKKYKGVTLMELVIVMAIMGIMGGVGFVSLQSSKSNTRLVASQREVASTIKSVQSYALQGRTQDGSTPCLYGFRFTSDTDYEIFYKIKNVGKDCTDVDPTYKIAEQFRLTNGATLSSPAVFSQTEMSFAVPFGGLTGPTITTFTFSSGGQTKAITINSNGTVTEN